MGSLRMQRVRELLKRELGEILRREFPISDHGLLSVNEVEVTGDLQNATVFVGVVGSNEQRKRATEMLQKERKRIQGLVGQAVVLKYTPVLRIVIDDSIERGNRVLGILEEIEKTLPPS